MPLTLLAPVIKTFKLEKCDETGDTQVTFRQATMKEDERRAELLADQQYSWNDKEVGVITRKTKWSYPELMRLECYLTMTECNIDVQVGKADDGTPKTEPLFKFGKIGVMMGESAFKDACGKLPANAAYEIHQCCLQVNKDWAPNPEA